jgi:gluconolactonase
VKEAMTEDEQGQDDGSFVSRRNFIRAAAVVAGVAAIAPKVAFAQSQPGQPPQSGTSVPNSVVSNPPRQWGPTAPPAGYPDPDVIQIDKNFGNFYGNTSIIREYHNDQAHWHEGPAWSAGGRYLIWSDVVGNVQRRWLMDDGRVTDFRNPSNNANGSTFDFEGRLITCEDFYRRVIRFEHDGSVTVLADNYQGKPLNSPNDICPHPDGSIWFTDPPYGDQINEGQVDQKGGQANGGLNPNLEGENAGGRQRELPNQVYRIDPSGSMTVVVTQDQIGDPNGIAFSPDYKTLFVISTGQGPGDASGSGGDGNIYKWDVSGDGKTVSNRRLYTDCMVDGIKCGPDGMRADVQGNMWVSSNAPLGYSGVVCYGPDGKPLGRIRLPEVCANVAFGGPRRNQLFMAASQSLYSILLNTQGAAPG